MQPPHGFRTLLACALLVICASPATTLGANTGAEAGRRFMDEAITGRCVPESAKDVLRSWAEEIRSEPTVEDARARLLTQTALARRAMAAAAWIVPSSDAVREARSEVATLERLAHAATTQGEVADDVLRLLAVPVGGEASTPADDVVGKSAPLVLASSSLDQSAVSFGGGGGGCDYSVGEVIIIVLGFLLFIIPGIIFLVIFC